MILIDSLLIYIFAIAGQTAELKRNHTPGISKTPPHLHATRYFIFTLSTSSKPLFKGTVMIIFSSKIYFFKILFKNFQRATSRHQLVNNKWIMDTGGYSNDVFSIKDKGERIQQLQVIYTVQPNNWQLIVVFGFSCRNIGLYFVLCNCSFTSII